MNPILEKIYDLLPPDKKRRNNGEIFFNAPCCINQGESRSDSKHRGNMLFSEDNCVYNCFNCHYSTGYTVGQYMSKKFVDLLLWAGATIKDLNDLKQMIREYNESNNGQIISKQIVKKREIRSIPSNYKCLQESLYKGEKNETLKKIYQYIDQRNPRLMEWSPIYWTENIESFLIPCKEYDGIVGYSLRSIHNDSKNKYMHYIPNGHLFNFDNLLKDRKYEILVEGSLDALAINGVAYLSSTLSDDRLKRLLPFTNDKELIICPDRDDAGKKIVDQVLKKDLPLTIAFPNWINGIKDCEEAVKKYGRLYTIKSIIDTKESDKTKIKLKSLTWFNN